MQNKVRNRISFEIQNFFLRLWENRNVARLWQCHCQEYLIHMQLAYRKVDIDILSLNFVIYVDTLATPCRQLSGRKKRTANARQKFTIWQLVQI